MISERDIERHARKLEPPENWPPPVKLLIRLIVACVGLIVLLAGIVMIVLPGPAFIVIPAGLAILASQFRWARQLLLLFLQIIHWAEARFLAWRDRRREQRRARKSAHRIKRPPDRNQS